MKKILVLLVVIAAGVFVGAPFITGKIAEQESSKVIDIINSKNSHLGSINTVSYDRGFSSSRAEYAIELSPALEDSIQSSKIEYGCDIDHGVTAVSYLCKLANEGEFKAFLDKYLEGEDPIIIDGQISAFGAIDQTISIQPVQINLDNGDVLNLPQKAELRTSYAQKTKEIEFNGSVPKLLLEGTTFIDLEKLTLEGQVTEARDGLYVGNMNISSDNIQAGDEKGLLTIDGLNIDTVTLENGQTVSSSMAMSSKNIEFPTPTGESESFSDSKLDLGIYGMDADALVEYIKVNTEMQQKVMATSQDDSEQNQVALASMTDLIPALENLLKQGLGFNIKSSFKSDGLENAASLDLNLLNDMQFTQLMGFLFAPDEALKNFKGNLDIDLKKELLEKYPQLALAVAALPLFVQTEQGASLQAKLDSGLFINDQATTIAELQGLFQ